MAYELSNLQLKSLSGLTMVIEVQSAAARETLQKAQESEAYVGDTWGMRGDRTFYEYEKEYDMLPPRYLTQPPSVRYFWRDNGV